MVFKYTIISFIIFCFVFCTYTEASIGDTWPPFTECMPKCYRANCTNEELFSKRQNLFLWLTRWSCKDECAYECMWQADAYFKENDLNVKFYGKWPFVRVLGMQEIVSVIASILNLLSHSYGLYIMHKELPLSPIGCKRWKFLSISSINTWFWSAVFHSRDTLWTERMDYFCALYLVLLSFLIFISRITYENHRLHVLLASLLLTYFTWHCYYMSMVKFDYGYNMKVNILFGLMNVLGWVVWWIKDRKRMPHLYQAAGCMVATMGLMSLEVWDFPPLFNLVDAHSLWHLGTFPIPFFFYRFVIKDSYFVLKEKSKKM